MKINDVEFNTNLEDILDELVKQLRLNNIQYIQKMVPTSTHIQVCCPYHKNGAERRPSAGIRRSDGIFHCLACNIVRSLPEVISYCFGYTDDIFGKQGWKWLLKNFATIKVEERKDVPLDFSRHTKDNRLHTTSDNVTYIKEEELNKY